MISRVKKLPRFLFVLFNYVRKNSTEKLLVLVFFLLFVLTNINNANPGRENQEKIKLQNHKQKLLFKLAREIRELDFLAKDFLDLECKNNEDFCWWFKFNLALGETGKKEISKFARSVPFYFYRDLNYGSFLGEAHIFQYPAHFLIKGIEPNLKLKSNQTIKEYLEFTNWRNVFQDAMLGKHPKYTNWELSWYWLGRKSSGLSSLGQIEANFFKNGTLACDGAFYLAGTSYYNQSDFERYALVFEDKIKEMLINFPEARQFDRKLYEFFLVSYLLEGYSLAGKQNLISEETLDYVIKFTQNFRKKFYLKTKTYTSSREFLEKDQEFAYFTTCVLGHLRYGAKLYLGIEKFHVNKFI